MSEDAKKAEETTKKKGGKLPVILALVVMLAAGGFFGMKMKGGGEKKKEVVKLGETVVLKEFLTNLADGNTYVRTEIAVHLKEGYKAADLEKVRSAVEDAIVTRLGTVDRRQTLTAAGKEALKKALATDINAAIEKATPKKEEEHAKEDKPAEEGDDKKEEKPEEQPKEKEEIPEGWHSAKGPVLIVYFSSFATQ